MTNDLRPYSEYKDSGLMWCPQVPSHWELKPNRAFLKQRKVLVGERHPEYTLLSLTKRGVIVRDLTDSKGKFSADMGTSQEVRRGDLVMCLFDVPETPRTVGLSDHDGMITGAYTVLEPSDPTVATWMEAFYIAMDDRKLLSPLYSGLRKTIPKPVFLGTKTPTPPPDEQRTIVRFIRDLDKKVNRFIRNRRRLIEVLNEQKRAIINRAVTRGLDPNVKLKPSGIDWLEEVPEHWEVRRLCSCLESVTAGLWGDDPTETNLADHIVCVRVADFNMITLGVSTAKLTLRAVPEKARLSRMLKLGDLVMEKSGGGDAEPVGRVVAFDLDRPAITSNFISRLRPDTSAVRSRFLLYVLALLQATRRNVPSIKQTTGIQNLNERHYFTNSLGLPPLTEQDQIIRRLDEELDELRTAQRLAAREIDLIREYRTRLIADVVTGKLDVRGLAPVELLPGDELVDEGIDDEEMLGDDEPELVEEAADADD